MIIGFVLYQHSSVELVLKKYIEIPSSDPPRGQLISTTRIAHLVILDIGEIHYNKENKTNGGKQIEFSTESNQFEKKSKVGINQMFSNC